MSKAAQSWLDYQAPEYEQNVGRWLYARDHYSGEVLHVSKINDYLVRKAQGETKEAFAERAKLADYTNHMAAVVDSLAGMLAAVESDANRVFHTDTKKGLGDPLDPGTPIGRLWDNADGSGTGYLTLWKLLSIELIANHVAWVAIDTDNYDNPQIRILPASSVTNWRYGDDNVLEEVLVEERVDVRGSIRDKPEEESRYTLFTLSGWERFKKVDGVEVATGESGEYAYEDPSGKPALPIFRVELPLKRNVGWLLAKKANAIFNKESERDHLLRHANFPRLILAAGDELYGKLTEGLVQGANVLQEDPVDTGKGHRYIAPAADSAKVASEILAEKVRDFYVTAFREYGDAARERTATEIRQDVSSGVGAFLQLLKAALDDAENNALWRLEQTVDANNREFLCHVERSDDFVTNDVNMVIERLRDRYFGKEAVVPIGREGRIKAAKMIAEWDGLEIEERDVEAAVDTHQLQQSLELTSVLPIPAEAMAQMAVRYLIQNGQIDPEATVPLEGGETYKLIDLVTAQARYLADAKQQMTLRQGESFPGVDPFDTTDE